MTDHTKHNIAVTMATYNRPLGLETVLDGIEIQNVADSVKLQVIVVDNSPEANARDYVERRATGFRWPLSYHHEATRGISFARNRGLRAALDAGADYVAFIDDDETPHEHWLSELVKVAEETGAAGVLGAVQPRFERAPAWWITSGRFFGTPDLADRVSMPYGYTGNALVAVKCIRALDLQFDPRYALTGGEDTLFFKAIRDSGAKTLHARNALTYEIIVPARATLAYLVKFWYRTGNTDGIIELQSRNRQLITSLSVLGGGFGRAIIGAAGTLITGPALLFKRVYPLSWLRVTLRGLGRMSSAFGIVFEEYRDHRR